MTLHEYALWAVVGGQFLAAGGLLLYVRSLDKRPRRAHEASARWLAGARKDFERMIAEVFLTPDDRQRLGLPPAGEIARDAAVKAAMRKNDIAPACTVHEWSAPQYGKPRRRSNQYLLANVTDNWKCYVRKCLACGSQQAATDTEGRWHDD